MKTINLIILSGFFSLALFGQDQKTQKVYYKNSQTLMYEYQYIIGNEAEVTNIVSRDSDTKLITDYDPGGYQIADQIKHGYYKEYYESGKLKCELFYQYGKREGQGKLFYPSGKLQSEFTFKASVLHGNFIRYYENGKKMDVCQYQSGKRFGKGFLYNEDGSIAIELDYLPNSELNYKTMFSFANAVTFYSKDKPEMKGTCKVIYPKSSAYELSDFEFLYNGKWSRFNEKGKLTSTENYEDDLLSGITTNFYPNGNKKEEINCAIIEVDGIKQSVIDGQYTSYHENGKISSKGLLVAMKDEDNTYQPKKMFVWRWYDASGNPIEYVNYISDEPKKTVTKETILKEEKLNLDLPYNELKQIALSKYGKNFVFYFQESLIPYLGCKYFFGECGNRNRFFKEVDNLLGQIYNQMEVCNSKDCLVKGIEQSNKVFQALKELSNIPDDTEYGIIESNLRNSISIEDKISILIR